ncbi:MAG: PAS domain S-box protein, partial [Dehalococcoidia bacterium]|nr:PAS domain S-box protein [Dehalococcoidia bacterium]
MMDVTERKRAEEALRESEERFRAISQTAQDSIFIKDRDLKYTLVNPAMGRLFGCPQAEIVGCTDSELFGEEARKHIREVDSRVLLGETVEEEYTKPVLGDTLKTFHVIKVPIRDSSGNIVALCGIARDITDRKLAEERLRDSFISLAETVSRAMEARDPYTSNHQRRVAELVRLVGRKMGLGVDRLRTLYIGALLHDIGKISIPEGILTKPGALTEEEWALVRTHTQQGYDILKDSQLPRPVAEMALQHHEWLDGSGYPDGLRGEELSLELRILVPCNVAEAMRSHRLYRPARSREETLAELRGERGRKYDPDVVDILLEIIEGGEFRLGGESG